jgi:uncharacterized protein YcfJ
MKQIIIIRMIVRKIGSIGLLLLTVFALASCTTAQKGGLIGAGVGGLTGGVIGHQSGHTGTGAAIGAGAGALGGALLGEQLDTTYCPQCGRRFTGSKEYCPYDGARLRPIQR